MELYAITAYNNGTLKFLNVITDGAFVYEKCAYSSR
jgi:hypothetical protein